MKDSGKDVKKDVNLLILHRGGVCLGSCVGRRPSILEKVVEIEEEEEEIVWRTTSSRSVSTKLLKDR